MTKRNRVLIYGWFGENNLGDELILASIGDIVRKVAPNAEISVMASNPRRVLKNHSRKDFDGTISTYVDHRPISILRTFKYGALKVLKNLSNIDLVVMATGGALSDWNPTSTIAIFDLLDLWTQKGIPVVFSGVGAGPIKRMESYEKFRIPLSKAVAITVRDEYSKRELEKIGLNNVYLSRDLVLTASGTHAPYLFAPREVHKIGIVAAPICTETPDVSELFIERLGQVASLLSSKYQVSIIPFQPDYDANVCIQLAGVSENVQLLSDSTDTWASLRYIEEQDLIIGLRFHSIVEALIKGKYVIPIVYHPKSASLCSEVGLDKYAQYVGNGNNWPLSNLDVKGIVRNVELIQQDENYFPSVSSFLNDVSECNIDEEIIRTILEKPDSSTR